MLAFMPLRLISDFDLQSREGAKCSVNGTIKRPEDPGVFRGPLIDMEGYFDICADVIREAAHELGMIDEDRAAEIVGVLTATEVENTALRDRVAELEITVASLSRSLANLVDVERTDEGRKVPAAKKRAPRMAEPEL